jgi:hypothetical protein
MLTAPRCDDRTMLPLKSLNVSGLRLRSDGPISVEDHMRYGIVVWSIVSVVALE